MNENLFAVDRQQLAGTVAADGAGYIGWLRNIAVALGNAPTSPAIVSALQARAEHPSELVREHVRWALKQHDVG